MSQYVYYCGSQRSRRKMDSTYNPLVQGAISAIRIYNQDGYKPMAQLVFALGKEVTIEWDNVEQRKKYAAGINAYTYIYDEREKCSFNDWICP